MWQWLQKIVSSSSQSTEANRVDALVRWPQLDNRMGDLERELKALEYFKLSRSEQEAWWHLYRIVSFRAGRDLEAFGEHES